jgi:uncharacterized protein
MTLFHVSFAVVVVFAAAIVRGFSGFGFSLLTITALSIVFAPADVIPVIFILEIAASLHLLPSIWKDVHWRSLLPLFAGCLVATPIGVWLLANASIPALQLAMSAFAIVMVALMAKGFALKSMPGTAATTVVGAAAGLANGALGIGGPPVILFYFATPAGHAAGRASLIAFFLVTDVIALANQAPQGLLTWHVGTRSAILLPPLILGVWIGARQFKSANPETFRKVVLAVMALLAVILGIRAILQM